MYPSQSIPVLKAAVKKYRASILALLVLLALSASSAYAHHPKIFHRTTLNIPAGKQAQPVLLQTKKKVCKRACAARVAETKSYGSKKYGFQFKYPAQWIMQGKEVEVMNASGALTTVQLNFKEEATQTSLLIEYHLAPGGADIYKYALQQYNASAAHAAGEVTQVAGNKALQMNQELTLDGRGNPLTPPLHLVVIHFLDKAATGDFEVQLKSPVATGITDEARLKQLLASFKISN